MSGRKRDAPPPPGMVQAVDQMFRQLEALAPDPNVAGACPELPGIVLQRITGRVLDPNDPSMKPLTPPTRTKSLPKFASAPRSATSRRAAIGQR